LLVCKVLGHEIRGDGDGFGADFSSLADGHGHATVRSAGGAPDAEALDTKQERAEVFLAREKIVDDPGELS